jgi:hypothetical protein
MRHGLVSNAATLLSCGEFSRRWLRGWVLRTELCPPRRQLAVRGKFQGLPGDGFFGVFDLMGPIFPVRQDKGGVTNGGIGGHP